MLHLLRSGNVKKSLRISFYLNPLHLERINRVLGNMDSREICLILPERYLFMEQTFVFSIKLLYYQICALAYRHLGAMHKESERSDDCVKLLSEISDVLQSLGLVII